MKNNLSKSYIVSELPIKDGHYTIRSLERMDLDTYSEWPDYPVHYKRFNTSLKELPYSERDKRWRHYHRDHETIELIVDHAGVDCIAKFTLKNVNWKKSSIGNVGIRLHPDYCDKGHGSTLLSLIRDWCFRLGILRIQFDVLKSNERAIQCYLNSDFKIITQPKSSTSFFCWMESVPVEKSITTVFI